MSTDSLPERPLVYACADTPCLAILHHPPAVRRTGVLIVVGGPQYRVGAHRSFVTLARALADDGFAVFRFDYRGLGDSDGTDPGFEALGPDIAAAIDAFRSAAPAVEQVVLWGLCDGATAAAFHAADDPRVAGVVLLNPWVHEEAAYDRVLLKHYYSRRALSRDFWRKLMRGRVRILDFPRLLFTVAKRRLGAGARTAGDSLAARLIDALRRFPGPLLLITSGHDLTATEFAEEVGKDQRWPELVAAPRLTPVHLAAADHTFSEPGTLDAMIAATRDWLERLDHSS